MMRMFGRALVPLFLAAVFAVACGGSDDENGDNTGGSAATGAVARSFSDVQPAVIQILARGTLRDPAVGLSDGSGAGSGFIISEDGLAVTNNHVVTGAATLEVFIGGDSGRGYNATVLGVSECNDLALLQINTSDSLPYLTWHDQPITPGLEIYAAGFPLGDPQYTLTRGVVSKAQADGDVTGTSSVDYTIEHDANIQPGNSGGPLVSAEGKVVGVNYAGGALASSTAQFFAIASPLAQPVVERLKDGDFESLGINGWAVYDASEGIAGIWVAGVAAGSPAAQARILPGDVITSMNGLPVGTDGTFKDYCDVIRTAGPNPIAVDVLRYDTGEYLRGEINGSQPIEPVFTPSTQVQTETSVDTSAPVTYSGYVVLEDDTGSIFVEVPAEWNDIDTEPVELDSGDILPYIAAAPNLNGFLNTYDVPGMLFAKLEPQDDLEAILDAFAPEAGECIDLGLYELDDPTFDGIFRIWNECGGTLNAIVVLAAEPADGAYAVLMAIQITSEADLDVLDHLFATFDVWV